MAPDGKLLWFKDPKQGWVQVELHGIDAAHALEVDPENWAIEKPEEPAVEAVKPAAEVKAEGNTN